MDRVSTKCDGSPKPGNLRYGAEITAGALKVPESRVVAGLLLSGVSDQEWRQALYADNLSKLVRRYLEQHEECYVLRCLQVGP